MFALSSSALVQMGNNQGAAALVGFGIAYMIKRK